MIKQVVGSVILLLFLGALFAIPIMALCLSAHTVEPALIAGVLVLVFVFLGPFSFAFSNGIATDFQLTLISVLGVVLVLAWVRASLRDSAYWVPYTPVTGWALMGAYFCVLQLYQHAT